MVTPMNLFDNLLVTGTLVGLTAGTMFYILVLWMLPRKLRAGNEEMRNRIISKAKKKAFRSKEETILRTEKSLDARREEEEEELTSQKAELEITLEEIEQKSQSLSAEESRIAKRANDLKAKQEKLKIWENKFLEAEKVRLSSVEKLQSKLEKLADTTAQKQRNVLKENLINNFQVETTRLQKIHLEDLESDAKKLAGSRLNNVLARYAPTFTWPKTSSVVEIKDPKRFEQIQVFGEDLIEEIRQLTEDCSIELTSDDETNHLPAIKISGGFGLFKEAAKLSLDELVAKGKSAWPAAAKIYEKHRKNLDNQAVKLGAEACRLLQISDLHPEIQRMVGHLYWRTSYRQNQFYHSVEVATLAGILASEMGVDPMLAKRTGLLHDIGKGIDYRLEGGHAVISADYADRFGEKQIICDAVLSHHNDIVLETPLANVLKSADTLSGARPGARVNLELGYQTRLSGINDAVRSFPGISSLAIMNGGREVHIEVSNKKIKDVEINDLAQKIARKIEEDVAYPGQIKVLVSRKFEATSVA